MIRSRSTTSERWQSLVSQRLPRIGSSVEKAVVFAAGWVVIGVLATGVLARLTLTLVKTGNCPSCPFEIDP